MTLIQHYSRLVIGVRIGILLAYVFGCAMLQDLWGNSNGADLMEADGAAASSPKFPEILEYSLLEPDPKIEFLSENERNQYYAKLGNIVDPIVYAMLSNLELRDHQIEPMKQEIRTLFVGRVMLLNMRRIEIRKADENLTQRRKAINGVNDKLASLYARAKKNVRNVLERKQFKQYNRMIAAIAPPPKGRKTPGSLRQDKWLSPGYHNRSFDNPSNPTTQHPLIGSSNNGPIR